MTRSTGNADLHPTSPRLFVAAPLSEAAEIAASTEQAHYLGGVLRRASGDIVRLFNGSDGEWRASLRFARRDRLSLLVERQLRPQALEVGPWLLFAPLKRDATDLVVRQAVELGVSRIIPVLTERTNTTRVNGTRLRAIATEAAEQSERLTVPPIEAVARLYDVLSAWPPGRLLFVAMERSCSGIPESDGVQGIALLIGPEGGFTQAEREHLDRRDFVTTLSIGPHVLRAETAAVAGLALLLRGG
jgi:16S rRNA (uracil1498-N3)-methyltransferase